MFLRLLAIETRKTLQHPALWIGVSTLFFILAVTTLIGHLQVTRGYSSTTGGLEVDIQSGLQLFSWIGILVYSVTASVIAAFDYPDRSIQLWLTRGVPRPLLLLARLTVILLFSLLLVFITMIVILGFSALSRVFFFGTMDASNLNQFQLLPAILRIFWSSIPYLALTVLFAIISRSPLFAAGGTIVYASVLEPLLGHLTDNFPDIIQYLPSQLAQILQINNLALDRTAPLVSLNTMSEPHAIFAIGILFIVLSSISLIIFSLQDLGG
jgi:ABC-type transport system involved in multi-copper enzyme maturation permease subunit